jgi:SHS2 domain-containing protein
MNSLAAFSRKAFDLIEISAVPVEACYTGGAANQPGGRGQRSVHLSPRAQSRLLAHTADIGLEVRADSRELLFAAAARGLKRLLYGASPATARLRREVVLEASAPAELLVAWLNEILVFCEMARAVPAGFLVRELDDCRLVASIDGEPFDPARHVVERTAKAVTYHKLAVEERAGGWYARVYIDL